MALPNSEKDLARESGPVKSTSRKYAAIGGTTILLLLVLYVIVSPYIAVRNMKNAIVARDADGVSSYIDFPVFKERFKAELKTRMISDVNKNIQKDKDNPFAAQGMLRIDKTVNTLADSLISPEGIKRALSGDSGLPQNNPATQTPDLLNPKLFDGTSVDTSTAYKSFDVFSVVLTSKVDSAKSIEYLFERHNLISWKLTNIKF